MRLSNLSLGDNAKVTKLFGHDIFKRKLMDMGVVKGETITIVKIAPLGDPMEIKVKGYLLSLRRHEAENIEVEKL